MSLNNIYNGVLDKPIPDGGYGRPMTLTEVRRLRRMMKSQKPELRVSNAAIVLRCFGNPDLGVVYNPEPNTIVGYNNTGINVNTK